MSWSFSVARTPAADFEGALERAAENCKDTQAQYTDAFVHMSGQVDYAVSTLKHAAKSGKVREPYFYANASGHAHSEGNAGDTINVGLGGATEP